MKKLIVFIVASLTSLTMMAQMVTTEGTDFWLAAEPNWSNTDVDQYTFAAGGKRDCTVTVRNDAGTGNVEVEPSRGSRGEPRIGRGITGMRERVALHGGTLEIDDAPGGFTVVARLQKG